MIVVLFTCALRVMIYDSGAVQMCIVSDDI